MSGPAFEFGFGEIATVLAPRHPHVLVDRVTRCEPGTVIETLKAVSGAEPCYADLPTGLGAAAYHYPEALILDSFAQSAALLWAATTAEPQVSARHNGNARVLGSQANGPTLAGTRGVTFHHPVLPGNLLRLMVRLVPGTASTMFFTGRGSLVDGPLVLTVDNLVLTTFRTYGAVPAAS